MLVLSYTTYFNISRKHLQKNKKVMKMKWPCAVWNGDMLWWRGDQEWNGINGVRYLWYVLSLYWPTQFVYQLKKIHYFKSNVSGIGC